MKKDIHPADYRPVVFQDTNDGTNFLTRSTVRTKETVKLDGVEYPLVKVHISSASHPFYTGEERVVDVEGRVDRFKAQQAAAEKKRAALANKAKKSSAKKEGSEEKTKKSVQKIGSGSLKPKARQGQSADKQKDEK